jgi:hypothetical protein
VAQFRGTNVGASQSGAINRGNRNNAANGGFAAGEIITKDDKSFIIKLNTSNQGGAANSGEQGGSKIILFSDSAEIIKSVSGAVADLEIGKSVVVTGTVNSDGSITAKQIQLRPDSQPVNAGQ